MEARRHFGPPSAASQATLCESLAVEMRWDTQGSGLRTGQIRCMTAKDSRQRATVPNPIVARQRIDTCDQRSKHLWREQSRTTDSLPASAAGPPFSTSITTRCWQGSGESGHQKGLLNHLCVTLAEAGGRTGNRLAVNVGGEYLHLVAPLHRLLTFGEQDGDGICLLAGGTARRPDADHGVCGLVGEELGDGRRCRVRG